MKLYTEEQVRKAYFQGWIDSNISDGLTGILRELHPIELPSDEEIEKASFTEKYQVAFNPFASGAKWMRDKIQGGNNEQQ